MKSKVIVIVGPTASGKTALSIELAKKIDGEIVSCDSMQIYKDMTIGSAKPTIEEMQGIKHYLIDFVSPSKRYSVAEYKKQAEDAIEEIIKKGKVPIVVGGTGLYADSLIYNIEYTDMEFDKLYREMLEKQAETEEGLENLYKEAKKIDEVACKKISKADKKRIIRILEIFHKTGKTKTRLDEESRANEPKYDYKVFAIDIKRDVLYDRINKRVDQMLDMGLIDEVKYILEKYNEFPTAMQAIGYKEVKEYLEDKIAYDEMVEKIKQETRRYAKRQLTWFRKNKDKIWLDGLEDRQNNVNIIYASLNKAGKECR